MIRFSFGTGDESVQGTYTPVSGVVITTPRPAIADLAATLQAEIEHLAIHGPDAILGRYAAAESVLRQWGASVDTSRVPALRANRDY